MWTYLLGPFVSILPKRWRDSLPFSAYVRWRPATTISGLAEFVGAFIALMHWYSYAMTAWVGRGVEAAMSGELGPGVTDQAIGSVALSIWATHPLTWFLGYCGLEGAVRLCSAAFADQTLGVFPLYLLDKVFGLVFRRRGPGGIDATGSLSDNLSSYAGAIRERMLAARLRLVSDELWFRKNASEEILEIRSCRRKEEWIPPRVVRHQDSYYRLREFSLGAAPRPFHYILQRLPAGVPGRSVLLYSPTDAVIREQH